MNPTVSPSRIEVEVTPGEEPSNEQRELLKAQSIIELLPKDIENMATLLRQLKLFLTVNEGLRESLAVTSSAEILASVAKRCLQWGGILSDLLLCLHMTVVRKESHRDCDGASNTDTLTERYNQLIEIMCGYGIVEVCICALKKLEKPSENTRLACLELLLLQCDFASTRGGGSTPPPGRDVVFDGSALVKNIVHLLVKNGAVKLLPSILMENYRDFASRGAECVVQLLLFAVRSCSRENAAEICRGVDKRFVSAAVVALYKSRSQGGGSTGTEEESASAVAAPFSSLIVLVAG